MNKVITSLLLPCINKQLIHHIHTSDPCRKLIKFQMFRQQKIMIKLIHRLEGGRKKISPAPTAKTLAKTDGEDGRSGRSRVSVLNKLFMRHITDMMVTGEIAEMVKGRKLEISQVKVAPNFSKVFVLWLSKGDPNEENTEIILAKVAGMIRHELSQLKVIGIVPTIQFVKDTQYAKVIEVERALAKADFGEDFEPTLSFNKLKAELTVNTKLEPDIVEKIKELEKMEDEELIEEPMPPMRQDVLGLNRDKMMGRIERILQKAPTARLVEHREDDSGTSIQEEKIKFNKFLREREMTRKSIERNQRRKVEPVCEEVIELERKKYFIDEDVEYEDYKTDYQQQEEYDKYHDEMEDYRSGK